MSRYIEAEKLKHLLNSSKYYGTQSGSDFADMICECESADVVSRQDAYDVLTEYYHHRTDMQHMALKEALGRVPSTRPKGYWIDDKYCSVCGCGIPTDVWGHGLDIEDAHYCVECGADMRGGA